MHEIGEIMHVAGSGRVIIRVSEHLPEGQVLCDRDGTRVAKVMELIGPVKEPFASASPLTNSIKKYIGKAVFASQQQPQQQQQQQQQQRRPSQRHMQKTRRRRTR